MKITFNDDFIFFEENDFKYHYIESDPKELYKVLQLLIEDEENLEFNLNSQNLLAKKFYDILDNEFGEEEL